MSLPPLLLARLKQRGIIKENNADDKEEVFAESYDKEDDEKIDASEKYRGGAPGCPNKYNYYHICTDFCFDHWREGYPEHTLSEKYMETRNKMLKEYPLPNGWKEVYDAGVRRHYYWCPSTDEVSWLSPKHPQAVISEAAPKIAKEMFESLNISTTVTTSRNEPSSKGRQRDSNNGREERDSGRNRKGREDKNRGYEKEKGRKKDEESGSEAEQAEEVELNDRDRLKRAKRRGIDPMDPAAYGDVPTGNWSTGIVSDAKTGVDTTANGPLFQQRPYPAPGAILRKNNPNFDSENK
uniref:Polyglutamine-binding protein 1 n=1 Tax=Dendroctonus ponderosae TaxID=77166 RepID=J3JUS8_DENPD|nr:unknown [Dendroctonus ponderosae]